ncbi:MULTISPECIES: cysteine synthase A [Chromohalobacter]|uniref:Cysteine synthase n=1 Tax=Chromohalobacter israelensis (strain ATCC BAA-138 / DSM 3043 / CIP 106854 / NCIMB 13768 / 1H11) TaxID=290398 RepID=Q1QXI8_CHRI1|nr:MULTISPECIES: cysteine synthase A [Chromohalobacter]ABE58820.1 cysteine synthase [Chromohalobacter salexigens DSM 3043]MBZ5877038.1 cysteine synthase A [Chromohalobacter salexigens]MDF9433722.1 cysteine synthase A [Chromohalobacter israelensis]MDO0944896.1 cysteine synthase A [Chromohalobacter salexigens]NQY44583.1 cysteine synthase A [Chromohalobacter sp.]
MAAIFEDNSASIGKTPLVRIRRLTSHPRLYAKIEARNPAFSVKCRVGANLIWDAEHRGLLTPGKEILEPTSGNTGIALAFAGAARGYPVTLTMPASMSLERRKVLKALGATIVLTEPAKGMQGAVDKANDMLAAAPERYYMPQQFENPANPSIHEDTTGPELWNDTDGKLDVLVAGVGTGGTLTGVSRYFEETRARPLLSVAVEPAESPIIAQALRGEIIQPAPHKIQGIGANFIPANLDLGLVDRVEGVTSEDAMAMAQRLMREEGILCGISCGAAMVAALRLADDPAFADKAIAVVLPDSGERYLSGPLFENVFTEQELTP